MDKTAAHDSAQGTATPSGAGAAAEPTLASAADPDSQLVGRVLNGAYRIDGLIGMGGMGAVYRATQVTLGRTVAVKTILAGIRSEDTTVQRFFREARLLSQLSHPNLVQVIDFGSAEPGPVHFMVMEYLRGESLEAFVRQRPQLTMETVLDIMTQLCAGLTAAHESQVIHRDLKPSNIFLANVPGGAGPMVKVLDFGLAKLVDSAQQPTALTQKGMIMGTLGYSAPEQMQGESDLDPRGDVYSLGAILYFLIAGKPPYEGDTFRAVLTKQMTRPPEPIVTARVRPEEARAIEPVIRKAMSLYPADRYATPGAFLAQLQAAARPFDTRVDRKVPSWVGNLPAGVADRLRLPRRRGLWAAGVTAAVLLVGLGGWWLTRGPRGGAGGPEGEPPPPAATAPGVTATEIRFGMSAPFSGPSKELGRALQTGIETCFKQANDEGGVHRRKLHLVALDDGYEPARAAANMRRLLDEEQVFGFVGNVGTATTEAALPVALEQRRVFFAAYTGAGLLRRDPPDRYVFNFRASYAEETAAIVRYLVDVKRIAPAQIAVFAQKDGYGDAGFAGVARAVRRHGHDPEQTLRVGYTRNTADVDEAVATVLANRQRVRAVVMVATYRPAALFIKRLKDAKLAAVFTNVSFVGSEALAEQLRELGPQYPEGVIVTQVVPHFNSGATAVRRYRELLKKYSPEESPGFVSLEGYLAAAVLVQGLRNAGDNLTPETLVDGFEAIHGLDLGVGTPITFGPSEHQALHKVWGTVLDASGTYQVLDLD